MEPHDLSRASTSRGCFLALKGEGDSNWLLLLASFFLFFCLSPHTRTDGLFLHFLLPLPLFLLSLPLSTALHLLDVSRFSRNFAV